MAQFSGEPDEFTAWGARRCCAVNSEGNRCGRAASRHLDICEAHGAKLQNNAKLKQQRELESEARKVLAKVAPGWEQNPEAVGNPVQAMADLAGRDQYLADHVWAMLESKDHDCECCGCSAGLDGSALVAYGMVSKGLRASLTEMDKMKINERMVDIEDQKLTIIILSVVSAIQAAIPGATDVQMAEVRSAFLTRLTELEKAPPPPSHLPVWT